MAKNEAVFGIYTSRSGMENAVSTLKDAGFANTDVSILFPESLGTSELATEKSSKAPEGAAAGAGSGLLLGGALGWFIGVGALAIPGVGPLIAAGPIMAALAGAGIGSAVGGVAGAVVGMGIPEYEAKKYEARVSGGNILLSVHCESAAQRERAKEVLQQTGAEDISATTESTSGLGKAHSS
jgi:rhodanese-related sulfurtransferase